MRTLYVILWIVLCLTGLISFCVDPLLAGGGEGKDSGASDKRAVEIDKLKRREIQIFGLVVDQNGNPVNDAEVMIHWEEFSTPFPGPMKKKWIKTDEKGGWEFKQKAMRATVREARSDGFVFSMKQQDFGGFTSEDLKNNRTSPTNRIVLRLHKTGEPVFLITDEADLARASIEKPVVNQFDLFHRKTLPITEATNQPRNEFYPDLEVRVEHQETNGIWRVAYRTPTDCDGLIVTNALLFEAPATGYVLECVLEGSHDQDFPRYLYIRTRTPAVYTRFEMNYSLRPDSCVVSYKLWSNPYGTRSLEPKAELEPLWQLREQLTKDARTEIVAGRRLNKSDLPKLIKEAKEKARKDTGKQ